MNIVNFSFFLILFHFLSIFSLNAGLTFEQQELILKHQPPAELKEKLDRFFFKVVARSKDFKGSIDSGKKIIQRLKNVGCRILNKPKIRGNIILEHEDIKEYIIKLSIYNHDHIVGRVRVADKIRESIQRHEFKDFIVPKKYLYHFSGAGEDLIDENYCVVVKKLNLQEISETKFIFDNLRIDKLDELLTIVEEAELGDLKLDNIRFTQLGDLAFIDTEDIAEEYSSGLGFCLNLSQKDFDDYINFFKRNVLLGKDSLYTEKIEKLARSVSRRNRDIARKIARKTIVRARGIKVLKGNILRDSIEYKEKRKLFRRYSERSREQIDELIEQSQKPLLEYTFGQVGQPPLNFNDFSK